LLLVFLVLFVPASVGATPFDLAGSDWEGGTELVRLARAELGTARVVATTQVDFAELTPDDGLLLLYRNARSTSASSRSSCTRAGA